MTVVIPANFNPVPSHTQVPKIEVQGVAAGTAVKPIKGAALAVAVSVKGRLPEGLDLNRKELATIGFEAKASTAIVLPTSGQTRVLFGTGDATLNTAGVRDAVAAAARAADKFATLQLSLIHI